MATQERFVFVDGLRGLAALAVAAYHINRYGPLVEPASTLIPWPIQSAISHGWMGVQVFFVISGFVIAYSVRNERITPGFVGSFALRRSIRLDPAYWTTIAVVLVLASFGPRYFDDPSLWSPVPTWPQLAAHLGYLQNVVGYDNISVGFWTLCIEVQFYLLFIALLGVAQKLSALAGHDSAADLPSRLLVLLPVALASLFVFHVDHKTDVWIVHFFGMFFLGVLAWWTHEGRAPRWIFWSYVGVMLVRLGLHWSLDICVATIAGVTIHGVGRLGRLGRWLNSGWLQYLGRISYSLYLIHYPTACAVAALGFTLTGEEPVAALFWLLAALAASIGVAHLLYRYVEAPSISFAKHYRQTIADVWKHRPGASWKPVTKLEPNRAA
jgi:peptidoglycan/LPS O-acetylase OafA/YrhL